jgi:hypothetical protein
MKNVKFSFILQKMNVVSIPKEQYGNFYKGDSYIVLSVSKSSSHLTTLKLEVHIYIYIYIV